MKNTILLLLVVALLAAGSVVPMAAADYTTTYTYDKLGRVLSVRISSGISIDFAYDANGNRTVAGVSSASASPTVVSVAPADGAKGIATSVPVIAAISKPVDPTTVSSGTFFVTGPSGAVSGTITVNDLMLVFVPASPLQNGASYSASVTSGVKDTTGHALAARQDWSFTTIASPDVTPPAVVSTAPAPAASGIPLSSTVSAIFSEALDKTTVNTTSFQVLNGASSLDGTVSYNSTTHTATFKPDTAFEPGVTYTAALLPTIADLSGNRLAVTQQWQFTTASGGSKIPPKVSETTPSDGDEDVALRSSVGALFSKALDPSTVTTATFVLKTGSATVPATVSYNPVSHRATLIPSDSLMMNVVYTATLTTGIKDATGLAMASPVTWSFTTLYVAGAPNVSMDVTSTGSANSSTSGLNGTTKTGYATLTTSGTAPYGTAVFSFRQNGVTVTEAGVPASAPTTKARIFIDYRSSVVAIPGRSSSGTVSIDTGIAVVNTGSTTANITYTLRDMTGKPIPGATGNGTLAAGAHFATFIDNLKSVAPNFVLPPNFATTTQFVSLEISSDQPLSVLALRMTVNQRGDALFTTTPVADWTRQATTDSIGFPHFADGGGYTTSIILLNTSNAVETGTLQFLSDDGKPVIVNQVGGKTDSSFPYSIPIGGVFRFQTDGSPATTGSGWVQLTATNGTFTPFGAGVFSYNPGSILLTESGVPAAVSTTHARVYVDMSGGHDTGLAIANPSGTSANITVKAYQSDGVTAAGTSQTLPALAVNGHMAAFAESFVTGLPNGFTGVLDISSSATTPFVALALRSLNNERGDFLLTTFPIADQTRPAPSPIVFPHIADGGGYVTQFILIGAGGASSVTLSFYAEDGTALRVGK